MWFGMIGLVKVVRFGDRFMEVGNFRDGLGVHNRPQNYPLLWTNSQIVGCSSVTNGEFASSRPLPKSL